MIFNILVLWVFSCWILLYRLANILTIYSWRLIVSTLWYNFRIYSLRILSISSH
jgi:hypothetical protein